jgi:hypothetical protein
MVQKLVEGDRETNTHRQDSDFISPLFSFRKEIRVITSDLICYNEWDIMKLNYRIVIM